MNETLNYDVFHVEQFLNHCIGQSDHRTEYESTFYHIRFFLDLLYMYLFELSNANLSSITLRFISHAFTPRRVEQSTRGLFIQQNMNIRSHKAEFKLLVLSVVLVCCVGIPHPLFVRLVSSDHSLPILYIFYLHIAVHESENNFWFPPVLTINLQRHEGIYWNSTILHVKRTGKVKLKWLVTKPHEFLDSW